MRLVRLVRDIWHMPGAEICRSGCSVRATANHFDARRLQLDCVLFGIHCSDPLVGFPGRISRLRNVTFKSLQ